MFCFILYGANNIVKSQSIEDTNWTTIHVYNNTSICKLFNLKLHYSKGNDTSWCVSLNNKYGEYLLPKETQTFTAQGRKFPIRYYTYDCNCGGNIIHRKIDEQFVLERNNENLVKISDFFIPPKWWQTWWFFIVVVFSAVILLWFLLKYLTNLKLKKEKRELEQKLALQKERLRISTEMHDDIGAGLLAIRLQAEVLFKYFTGTEMEGKFNNIHNSIRDIASKVREVIWSLDIENDTLINFISFIHQQAYRMFENSNLELQITSMEEIPTLTVLGEHRRNLYLTIKEALHNILKHSSATIAIIKFSIINNNLNVEIVDNGKGVAENLSSIESTGLRNMKERIIKLNGDFNFSTSKSGTEINLIIPLASLKS